MKYSSKKGLFDVLVLGQTLNSVRLIAILFIVSSVSLRLIYDYYLPNFIDSFELRWGLNIVVTIFLISTFVIKFSPKKLSLVALLLYLSILFYSVYLVVVNEFHPFAVTILMLVMTGGTVLISSTIFYFIQSALVLLIIINSFFALPFNHNMVIVLYNIVFTIGVCGTVLFVRLKMLEDVNFSNSLLEKIHLFAIVANKQGEILYVSPSVDKILGYESRNLLKQGWWDNRNLAEGWIQKEYILNYPEIIPSEIRSIEKSVFAKNGHEVKLNWTNSILPDGNYMGTAMDITSYNDPKSVAG